MIECISIEEAIALLQPSEVEELNPEISVPAEHVDGIVYEIFKRYLDMELTYNKR